MRFKFLVSGCILQSISYLQVISLFIYLHCLKGSRTGAREGGEAGVGGSSAVSDRPQTERPCRLPTPPTHTRNRAKRQAKLAQALQQSIQNVSRADLNRLCRAKGYSLYTSGEKQHSRVSSLTQPRQREPKCFLTSPAAASQLVCILQFDPPWALPVVSPYIWARNPTLYIHLTLSSSTEYFHVPDPGDANQGRRLLSRTRSFPPPLQRETGNLYN